MPPLYQSVRTFVNEHELLARLWARDGVVSVDRLVDSPKSNVDGVPEQVLNNPDDDDLEYILSFLIDTTLEILFGILHDERAKRLLIVGQEARTKIRHRAESGTAAMHAIEKFRPQNIEFAPSDARIEEYTICSNRQIIDDAIQKLKQDNEAVLDRTAELQRPELIERFNNLPEGVSKQDRIEDFQEAALLVTLIGNVTDFPLEEAMEAATEYYEDLQVVDREVLDCH